MNEPVNVYGAVHYLAWSTVRAAASDSAHFPVFSSVLFPIHDTVNATVMASIKDALVQELES